MMFDRVSYKKKAREQLKGRWGFPILMTVIIFVLAGLLAFPSKVLENNEFTTLFESLAGTVLSLVSTCVYGMLVVAQYFVYLRMSQTIEKADFNTFLTGLERWLSGALGILWYSLWVFLWSLLFVIPGIVKSISYSQMFLILAENPEIGVRKAMNISKVITQGHKADLFVMGLSFLGWGFLCVLSCGIGFLWLIPYMSMSYTNSYIALKNMAIMTNKITPADFAPAY